MSGFSWLQGRNEQHEQARRRIVVIGAGAAGIAAARKLHDFNHHVTVLEAQGYIGGRVLTDYSMAPYPVELGAEFIHGDKIATWELIKRFGFSTRQGPDDDHAYAHVVSRLLGPNDDWTDALETDWEEVLYEVAAEHVGAGKPDTSLKGLIIAGDKRLKPLQEPALYQFVNNIIAPDYAAGLGRMGVYGFYEGTYMGDGDGDFYLNEGYSKLLTQLAEGLDIRLNTPVTHVEWSDAGATVHTQSSDVFSADKVIVTLPLAVLQSKTMLFDPALPTWKLNAIEGLSAGYLGKVILTFKEPFWQDDMSILYTTENTQVWWRPGWGHDDEIPMLTALIEDNNLANYSIYSEDQAIETALIELGRIFDRDVSPLLKAGRQVNWSRTPFIQMGYSYVPVNGVGLRSKLAHPVDDVLYFAGEATNTLRPATVHGAMESGLSAADQAMS